MRTRVRSAFAESPLVATSVSTPAPVAQPSRPRPPPSKAALMLAALCPETVDPRTCEVAIRWGLDEIRSGGVRKMLRETANEHGIALGVDLKR